jgi:hypothetical protein
VRQLLDLAVVQLPQCRGSIENGVGGVCSWPKYSGVGMLSLSLIGTSELLVLV